MRAGKITSVLLAGLLGTVSSLVTVLWLHEPGIHESLNFSSEFLEFATMALILGLSFLLILFPAGASIDRSINHLQRNLEEGDPWSPSNWLRPLIGDLAQAVDHAREERVGLRVELLDLRNRSQADESMRGNREVREREFSELKTDFISKASHELHTPLSSIQAYIELLIDGEADSDESRQEFYQIIQVETDRLGRLIENLLNISRIEAGMAQIELQHVKVPTLVNRVLEAVRSDALDKNITIETHLQSGVEHLDADRDMIFQVVFNLVANAIKHSPENGCVELRIEEHDATCTTRITVTDNGRGVPPEATGRIFEKFYRIDADESESNGGGLGLTLCKHIVETLHQGSIGVDSEFGQGATFWFFIPRHLHIERAAA